jgi:hypothetical protein
MFQQAKLWTYENPMGVYNSLRKIISTTSNQYKLLVGLHNKDSKLLVIIPVETSNSVTTDSLTIL